MWKSQTLHCKFPNRGTNKCYLSSNILVGVPFYKFINNSVMGNQGKKVEDTFHSQPCLSFCTIPFHLKGCFCAFRGQAFPDSSKKDTRLWRGFFFPPRRETKARAGYAIVSRIYDLLLNMYRLVFTDSVLFHLPDFHTGCVVSVAKQWKMSVYETVSVVCFSSEVILGSIMLPARFSSLVTCTAKTVFSVLLTIMLT